MATAHEKKSAPQPQLELAATVYTIEQLNTTNVDWDLGMVALAGRSNVGKSSCLNTLGNRKNLARISSTPGKTQSVNFFHVRFPGEDAAMYLVDLPGYGYAKRSKAERDKWAALLQSYLSGPRRPRTMVLLADGRHKPQQLDLDLVDFCLGIGLPCMLVCTKADKCATKDRNARTKEWRTAAPHLGAPLFFSSVTKQGKDALWARLRETAGVPMAPIVEGAPHNGS